MAAVLCGSRTKASWEVRLPKNHPVPNSFACQMAVGGEVIHEWFEKRLSVLSDDREGAPLPAPVELAAPTSKGLWEKLSNYSLKFYLTLACNRYGNDHSNEKPTLFVDGIQLANIPYEDRPARSGVTWSELEKALRCPRLRQNSFCCKFAVRPCDLSKRRWDLLTLVS